MSIKTSKRWRKQWTISIHSSRKPRGHQNERVHVLQRFLLCIRCTLHCFCAALTASLVLLLKASILTRSRCCHKSGWWLETVQHSFDCYMVAHCQRSFEGGLLSIRSLSMARKKTTAWLSGSGIKKHDGIHIRSNDLSNTDHALIKVTDPRRVAQSLVIWSWEKMRFIATDAHQRRVQVVRWSVVRRSFTFNKWRDIETAPYIEKESTPLFGAASREIEMMLQQKNCPCEQPMSVWPCYSCEVQIDAMRRLKAGSYPWKEMQNDSLAMLSKSTHDGWKRRRAFSLGTNSDIAHEFTLVSYKDTWTSKGSTNPAIEIFF